MSQRVNYDEIAESYDAHPFRKKEVDPDLLAFLKDRPETGPPAILDIGCGTGAQLVADRAHGVAARMAGLDRFRGMLRQACRKSTDIHWIHGDGAALPFRDESFDFITNQYSFHHVQNKPSMIAEVFRILRPRGRFVMSNITPRDMPGWTLYRFFPTAWEKDLRDFLPKEEIEGLLKDTGFQNVQVRLQRRTWETPLRTFVESARQRIHVSQLITIPDADYRAGLARVEEAWRENETALLPDEVCTIRISGEKGV
jgi:SAM-dependent methyltransferase